MSATWSGVAAPSSTDWVGVYAAGAADNAFVTYAYTSGGASGSANLTLPLNATIGSSYELRLFSNNGYTRLATSNTLTVQSPPQASLSGAPSSPYPGQAVSASWSGIAVPSTTDWVGIYAAGAADNAFVAFVYTGGGAAGSVNVTLPLNATIGGSYELRLFSNDGYTRLATSNTLTVQSPPPATLSASPTTVYSGQAVTATWSAIAAPSVKDWIGVYVQGAADNAPKAYVYTGGGASGSIAVTIPGLSLAGTYELRLFSNDGYTRLGSSNAITVQGMPPAALSASPSNVSAGGAVTATWSSIFTPTATDWIALYLPNAADNAFIAWRYTTGGAAGNVPFNIPANLANGNYQLRLFSNDGYVRLATASLTVGLKKLHFIHVDHLNTPRMIADDTQTAVWKWEQAEPFGVSSPNQDPQSTGTTFDFPLRLPGQYFDKETSLNYNHFRD